MGKKGRRTEEIADIVERMPTAFGKWTARAVCLFALLFLLMGWLVKYPDTVTGEVTINSNVTPVQLVAAVSGKIEIRDFRPQETVGEGTYLAVIENSASTEDVVRLRRMLEGFDPWESAAGGGMRDSFPQRMSLGDLDTRYYAFLGALRDWQLFCSEGVYRRKLRFLEQTVRSQSQLLEQSEEVVRIVRRKREMAEKWFKRYEQTNREVMSNYELETDRYLQEYLAALQEEKAGEKEVLSLRMQLQENRHQMELLRSEERERRNALGLALSESLHSLRDDIKTWEQRYVLKAPFSGKLELLDFLSDGMFVEAGKPLFSLIPQEQRIYGQMYLPANGAGKVKKGCKVKIKLLDFPYNEYGSIEGKVASMSLVSSLYEAEPNAVGKVYLITVELPEGLETNFGQTLPFKYGMLGEADIIVREKRLLQRLFDNLKYSVR